MIGLCKHMFHQKKCQILIDPINIQNYKIRSIKIEIYYWPRKRGRIHKWNAHEITKKFYSYLWQASYLKGLCHLQGFFQLSKLGQHIVKIKMQYTNVATVGSNHFQSRNWILISALTIARDIFNSWNPTQSETTNHEF